MPVFGPYSWAQIVDEPVFETGDRRYSGYVLAQLLGWPLSDNPKDYLLVLPRFSSANLPPEALTRVCISFEASRV